MNVNQTHILYISKSCYPILSRGEQTLLLMFSRTNRRLGQRYVQGFFSCLSGTYDLASLAFRSRPFHKKYKIIHCTHSPRRVLAGYTRLISSARPALPVLHLLLFTLPRFILIHLTSTPPKSHRFPST